MESCEVLIVGGGPAGSTCARPLVEAGLDVRLIDRARFPRDKVCAGWITPAVVGALQLDLDHYATTRTLQPITGFRTGLLTGSLRLTSYGTPVSYGIRRCEFDEYLLTRSGVPRIEDEGVRDLRREGNGWLVNGRIWTRMLVGAGGHFCPVARALSPDAGDATVVTAQEIEFRLGDQQAASCPVSGMSPELYIWPDLVGYGWCVRKGEYLNIGAGRLSPASLPAAMREFAAMLRVRAGVLPRQPKWKGHAYLLNRTSRRRLHDNGVLLVGDAAGLALTPSGEGILSAVESGLLAAEAILEARHDYTAAHLAAYAERVGHRFGRRARVADTPLSIPAWATAIASSAILGLPWLTRHVLIEQGFLHTNRPALDVAS